MSNQAVTDEIILEGFKSLHQAMTEGFDKVNGRIDTLERTMNNRFAQVDRRFERIEDRLDAMDRRFDAMDRRFDAMDVRFDAMDVRFDELSAKVDGHDRRIAVLEAKT